VQINLKPLAERRTDVSTIIRRLQRKVADLSGIALYMQAVQDLSVEDRVSRTQYQYSLEHPDPEQLDQWSTRLLAELRHAPALQDVATDQQNGGLRAHPGDRSRHGLTLRHHRAERGRHALQRLRPAAGLDDLHAVEPVPRHPRTAAALSDRADALADLYITTADNRQVPLLALDEGLDHQRAADDQPPGAVPVGDAVLQPLARRLAGRSCAHGRDATTRIGLPPSFRAGFQGTAQAFQASLANEGWLILAAIVTVYIVLGVLYESFIHPLTILSTLPSAGIGADPRARGDRARPRASSRSSASCSSSAS
jgi:multidrug efflux pump